jgi:hypothetical protein
MLLSHHQKTGQKHYIKVANSSYENVTQVKYLRTTVKNKNLVQVEIRRDRFMVMLATIEYRNTCLFDCSIKIKIRIYWTVILPGFCLGVKLGL